MKRFVIKQVDEKWEIMEFEGWELKRSFRSGLIANIYVTLRQWTEPMGNKVYFITVEEVE